MVKNDYRRAFIMLRAAKPGFGGHVRLEKRALTGNMYFIVTAPEGTGPLQAALAGQRDGQYYAAPLGALSRDRRGQLTLAAQFDPRAIDGRPLDAYAWVAVAEAGEPCALALTGNVEGSREVDLAALARAVCALYAQPVAPAPDAAPMAGDPPAADLPAPGELPLPELSILEITPEASFQAVTPEAPTTAEAPPAAEAPTTAEAPPAAETPVPAVSPESDVKIYTRVRSRASEVPGAVPANAEAVAGATRETVEASEAVEAAPPDCQTRPTAAQALGLDITSPWAEPAEPLRRLFATQAPTDSTLGGYTCVQAILPTATGVERGLIGIRAADGRITGIRYAVPGRYAPEPPAGLDDYTWNDAGYWVLDIGVS